MTTYGTSPLKSARRRRTDAELAELDRRLVAIVAENRPVTVRGAFYQAEVAGLVPKDEKGYDVVQRRLVRLRELGLIPYGDITDGTRFVQRRDRWNNMDDFATAAAQFYRRNYWAESPVRVEIWIEKDALSGVISPTVVDEWGLELFVARGFSSVTYLQSAAEKIVYEGRKTFVYVLGDFDPSGLCASQKVATELPKRARGVDVEVTHLAVTREQIDAWNLPTREVKRSDSRARSSSASTARSQSSSTPSRRGDSARWSPRRSPTTPTTARSRYSSRSRTKNAPRWSGGSGRRREAANEAPRP